MILRSAAVVVLATVAACRPPSGGDGVDVLHARWIDSFPPSIDAMPIERKFEVDLVEEWTWGGRASATAGWQLVGDGNRILERPERIVLICEQMPCGLRLDTDFAAGDVDAIEVELDGATKTTARLRWAVDGGEERRRQSATERVVVRGARSVVRWQVGHLPRWRGRITRLTIEPTRHVGQHVRFYASRALRYRLTDERLAELTASPWATTLDDETRAARLAVPGAPLRWPVTPPAGAALRFGVGVPEASAAAGRFEVRAIDGAREQTLFSRQVSPGSGWLDDEVELDDFAGRDIVLDFRFDGPAVEPPVGFAAWSSPEIVAAGSAPPPNIVLLSIDTLRPDHLSLAGYSRPTSPQLDDWFRRRAVWLPNTVTSAPWTLPAHVSMLTGVDAVLHGVNHQQSMPPSMRGLPGLLRDRGYATAALTGGGWVSPGYGFAHGFDRFRSWPAGRSRGDELESHVDRAIDWLRELPRPLFLFLHTFEVHSPHDRDRPFDAGAGSLGGGLRERFFDRSVEAREAVGYAVEKKLMVGTDAASAREVEGDDWPRAIAAYDNGIVHMDAEIGRLLDVIEQLGPTVVVLTSDHGEAFGEHGLASHGYLYDHSLLVPLLIAAPGEATPGRTIERQVRLVDVPATLLDYAGVEPPPGMNGRSLRRLVEGGRDDDLPRVATTYATSSNLGISLRVGNRVKYVFNNSPWPPIAGDERLFDLVADPGEATPAATDDPPASVDELRRMASAALVAATRHPTLELINRGATSWSGTLTGRCLQPLRVTTPDAGRIEMTWRKRQSAGFEIPAGGVARLRFESPEAPCVELATTVDGVDLTVAIERPEAGSHGRDLRAGRVSEVDAAEAIDVGYWWTPATEASPTVDAEADEGVRRQLEALGYLN